MNIINHSDNDICIDLNVLVPKYLNSIEHNISINRAKQIPPNSHKKIYYHKLSLKDLLSEFTKQYPLLLAEFPDFFEILRKCKYKNEIVLNDNYEFISIKLQKTVLSFIDSFSHIEKNEPDLIIALFKPKYKTNQKISNAMTQRISDKNIKAFEAFLKREQDKIKLNRLK